MEVTADTMAGGVGSACRTAGATTCPAPGWAVAGSRPGVNSNALTDEQAIDPLSGNVVLNGIPVRVAPLSRLSA